MSQNIMIVNELKELSSGFTTVLNNVVQFTKMSQYFGFSEDCDLILHWYDSEKSLLYSDSFSFTGSPDVDMSDVAIKGEWVSFEVTNVVAPATLTLQVIARK